MIWYLISLPHNCPRRGIANDPEHFAARTRCVSNVTIVEQNGPALLEAMYSYYAFIADDEQIVAECVGHKIRQWPRLTASGTLSEICDVPEIRETGRRLLESLDHRGFATVNMKRDADTEKLFVIEINAGRPGMGMFVAEAAGIEMTHPIRCIA